MTENKYEGKSVEELGKLWEEREKNTTTFMKEDGDMDLDKLSLFVALGKAKEAKETEDSVGVVRELRKISGKLGGTTCLRDLLDSHRHDEGFPKNIEFFMSFYSYDLTRILEDRVYPLRGCLNLQFRDHIQTFVDALNYGLSLEFEEGLRAFSREVTEEAFAEHRKVWLETKVQYQDILDRVVGDEVTPDDPTLNSLGEFEVDGNLIVTDPCYGKAYHERDLSAILEAQPGTWEASVCNGNVGGWGYRVMHLFVSLKGFEIDPTKWEEHTASISVDSGQAGFYCFSTYPEQVEERDEKFYDGACDSTSESDFRSDIHPSGQGVTSSTGFGDGGYSLYYVENDEGKVCAAKIVYIEEDGSSTDPGMIKFDYIFRRTSSLAQLEDGWAGEGSKAPSMETLETARKFALNGYAPDFIFANKKGYVTLYRIKREKGVWTKFVMTMITEKSLNMVGYSVDFLRNQRGNRSLQRVLQSREFPFRKIMVYDRMQKWAIKGSWQFTDPQEGQVVETWGEAAMATKSELNSGGGSPDLAS